MTRIIKKLLLLTLINALPIAAMDNQKNGIKKPIDDQQEDGKPLTELERAEQRKFGEAIENFDIVQIQSLLEQNKINPNNVCSIGLSSALPFLFFPLHRMVRLASFNNGKRIKEGTAIIDLLLKYGAELNLKINPLKHGFGHEDITSILIFHNNAELLKDLLEKGLDPIYQTDWLPYDSLQSLETVQQYKDKIKKEIATTVPRLPSELISIMGTYLFRPELLSQETVRAKINQVLPKIPDYAAYKIAEYVTNHTWKIN